jgi:hypothetical protein
MTSTIAFITILLFSLNTHISGNLCNLEMQQVLNGLSEWLSMDQYSLYNLMNLGKKLTHQK